MPILKMIDGDLSNRVNLLIIVAINSNIWSPTHINMLTLEI